MVCNRRQAEDARVGVILGLGPGREVQQIGQMDLLMVLPDRTRVLHFLEPFLKLANDLHLLLVSRWMGLRAAK